MRITGVLLLTIILLFTTGCWGQREMDRVGIVIVIGVDLEPDGLIRITVHSIQPFGSPMNPVDKSFTWIGTATGKSIIDAARNLRAIAARDLIWMHTRMIILGEEMARNELHAVLDLLSRIREIRYNCDFLVTEGKAFDLLQVPADIERNLAIELEGIINNAKARSRAYVSNIKQFLVAASSDYSSIITAKAGYYINNMNTFSTNKEEYKQFEPHNEYLGTTFIEGSGVFKNQKLTGWLNGDETRGFLWIMDKLKIEIVVAGEFRQGIRLAMETIRSGSKVKCVFSDGKPIIKVKTEVEGRLVEHETDEDLKKISEIKDMENDFANIIKGEMEAAVNKAKQYNSDIFGFIRLACIANPSMKDTLVREWDKCL
jgi:spore germination protein KC